MTLRKGEDVVCLPGARIEHVTERVENVLGHGQGGSILVHVGTNNADRDGTTRIVKRYRELVETLKKTRVEQIILSGILPVMRGRGTTFRNCKRMAINGLLEQMCEEEGVGFVDLWGYFVGKKDMFMRDGLHLSGKGAAVFSENLLRSMNNGTGNTYRLQLFKLVSLGGYTEKPNTRGIDKDSKKTSAKNSLESPTEFGYKCVCLNARSIVNKRNELNIMVEDIDPHIIGITESWATPDISDAELGMTGYVMFRKDRLGRRGGGVILYIKESIQAYEIKLEKEAECEEAVWCNIVTGNSTLTVGLVYRSPNISMEENEKIHNAIKEVSKRDSIIMGDFNHGHIQWTSLQSTGREDQEFLNLVQDSFLSQHVLEATRGENVLDIVLSSQKEFVDNVKICEPLGCSDHNQIHFIIKVKGERNRKIRYRKYFHKGRYKDMREYLAKIDWNNTLKNKTATECWNILKSEIDCVVDKFVPLKKQGKRSKKKHLSKEAIRKIKYKQMMWKTYRHTGSEEDYSIYKEALNQATAEIRNSKRSYEQKIAFNIKQDSKSFYAYVRSKQKVQDKVGPLEGSDGNIITEGFLMAENLNEYFSSVFTREDISILPILETKFEGREFDYL